MSQLVECIRSHSAIKGLKEGVLKMTEWLISPYVLNHWEQLLLSRVRENPSLASHSISFLTVSGCVSLASSSLFTVWALVAAMWRTVSPLFFPRACNGPVDVCVELWSAFTISHVAHTTVKMLLHWNLAFKRECGLHVSFLHFSFFLYVFFIFMKTDYHIIQQRAEYFLAILFTTYFKITFKY